GKSMEHAPKTSGDACDRAAAKRTTTTRHTSIVGQRFGEAHADGRAKRRGKADKKSTKRLHAEARRCKDWCQRRDRAVHQSQETRLDPLEHHGIATTICQRWIFQSHRASTTMRSTSYG